MKKYSTLEELEDLLAEYRDRLNESVKAYRENLHYRIIINGSTEMTTESFLRSQRILMEREAENLDFDCFLIAIGWDLL